MQRLWALRCGSFTAALALALGGCAARTKEAADVPPAQAPAAPAAAGDETSASTLPVEYWAREGSRASYCGRQTERDQISLLVQDIAGTTRRLDRIFKDLSAVETSTRCFYGNGGGGTTSEGALYKHSKVYWLRTDLRKEFRDRVFALGQLMSLSTPVFGDVRDSQPRRFDILSREIDSHPELAQRAPWARSLVLDELERLRPAKESFDATRDLVQVYVYLKTAPRRLTELESSKKLTSANAANLREIREIAETLGADADSSTHPETILSRLFDRGRAPTLDELRGGLHGLGFGRGGPPTGDGALLVGFDDPSGTQTTGRFRLACYWGPGVSTEPESSFGDYSPANPVGRRGRESFGWPRVTPAEVRFERPVLTTPPSNRLEVFKVRRIARDRYIIRVDGFISTNYIYLSRRVQVR